MVDYSSMRVPELKKLLAGKGLPQTGNKADLIARLQEDDSKSAAPDAAADEDSKKEEEKPAEQKEDEITYSDDEPASKPAPKAAAVEKPAKEAATEPAPAETAGIVEKADDAQKPNEPAPAASFALGLDSTAAEDEMKKRADRARRFGLEMDDETKKLTDRAKRFGIEDKEIATGLDAALPELSRKRGRGRNEGDGNRPDKRQSRDRRGGGGGGGGGGGDDRRNVRNKGRESNAGSAGSRKPGSVLDDPSEKAKAERRAARFATA